MEHWEYAAGYRRLDDTWADNGDSTTFEQAQRDLALMIDVYGDEDWVADPCVVKRSDRHPTWQPVRDHAAELLAELLSDMADKFGRLRDGIIQGNDIKAICTHIARGMGTAQPQEFDS